jgi:NAD(P)-dependent dehydrogenase (short-subunit alcohol dehydrogenase family)
VTSKSDLERISQRVHDDHGYCDVLFANSGVGGPGLPFQVPASKPVQKEEDEKSALEKWRDGLWEVPMDDFTKTMHVNCTGVLYTALAFLPLLLASNKRAAGLPARQQTAQILVTASIASFNRSIAHNPAYPASKAAVLNLVKTLATKLSVEDVRVNAIAPGLYPSEMTAGHGSVKEGKRPDEEGSMPRDVVPIGRMGGEGDMAATIVWMMGRGGSYLSGSVVVSDGGRLSILPATY